MERRVSMPALSLSDHPLRRRPRAKGGVFAFAPTEGHEEHVFIIHKNKDLYTPDVMSIHIFIL
jgi:hypothetical protein